MNAQQPRKPRILPLDPQQPVGGAIIDAEGREIPITERMIQQACRQLERAWQMPRRAS